MKKDFVTVTPDSASGNGSLSVVADKNYSAARSTVISVTGGGLLRH